MSSVNTVRGPVDSADLGSTLMHEHVFVLSPEIEKTSAEWDEAAMQAAAVQRLRDLKDNGIDTIVDLTVIGLGRFIPRIVTVADRVPDINIIAATGVYTYNEVPMYFHFQGPGTILGGAEPMTELFVREIRDGIGDTGVRAGILKCATDTPGITPGVERVLRAVAQAHRRTGVPITTHTPTPPQPWGLEQQRILAEEGVDLSRVVIGHSGAPSTPTTTKPSWPTAPISASTISASPSSRWKNASPRSRCSAIGATPTGSCSPTMPCATSTGSRRQWLRPGRTGGGPTSPRTSSPRCGDRGSARGTSPR